MSRFSLFIQYLRNNRIKEYDRIIQLALDNDYSIVSLRDYSEGKFDVDKKLLVLRHDVDHFSQGTKMMFDVEKKYKVYSSFYFRNSTYEPDLMREIEAFGSESSLHFEPIADFVKNHPEIKNKSDLFNTNFQKVCLDKLKKDIDWFRSSCGIPCATIASHGEYENILVQTPNNYLTEDIGVYEYLGIELEAYNKEMIGKVTCYISDVPIEENNGYKYGVTPFKAIESQEPFIMLLTHPNHWHYSPWRQLKKLIRSVVKKPIIKSNRFKRT